MQFSSLLGHMEELLGIVLGSTEAGRQHSGKPADSLIDSFFRSHRYLGSHDRRFIAETVYGTLRHLRKCRALVDAVNHSGNSLSAKDRLLLIVLAYLARLEKRSDLPEDAVIQHVSSTALKAEGRDILAKLRQAELPIVPGVPGRLGLEYSFPDWMCERFVRQYGDVEAEKLCAGLNHPASLTLRVNTLKTSAEDCQEILKKQGVATVGTKFSPVGLQVMKRMNIFHLQAFKDGLFEVQDEGSQLVPQLIDPKPTWKVLDACAGAGGKTLQLAAIMKNRGEVFATDVNAFRLDRLKVRARRAGAFNVRVLEWEEFQSQSEALREIFDVILIDAPCSGLGTIRRNPGMKWTVTEDSVRELSLKQSQILEAQTGFLKPGGRMFYVTCTMIPEENEDVVQWFLEKHPEYHLGNAAEMTEKFGLEGVVDGSFLRLLPHRHGTDGFFMAVLEKTGRGNEQ